MTGEAPPRDNVAMDEINQTTQVLRYAVPTNLQHDEDAREIRGVCMTADKDAHGTVILPSGATFRDSTPLLLGHAPDLPVGQVSFVKKEGRVEFVAKIAKPEAPPSLVERCSLAWNSVKEGLIRGVSVGANIPRGSVKMVAGVPTVMQCEVFELSLVSNPSNPGAKILATRSIEEVAVPILDNAPASGETVKSTTTTTHRGNQMSRFAARSAELQSARKLKLDRMTELQELAATENRSLTEVEGAEYDTLTRDVSTLDTDIGRVAALIASEAESAKVVETEPKVVATRSAVSTAPQAVAFSGKVAEAALVAVGLSGKKKTSIAEQVKEMGIGGQAAQVITRAAAAVVDTAVAAELVDGNPNKELLDAIREQSVLFQIGFQSAPFGKKFVELIGLPTANAVSELGVKRISSIAFDEKTVPKAKIVAGVVVSEEALEDSDPALEPIVSKPLTDVVSLKADYYFFNPANGGGGPNDVPVSPWNGITPVAGSSNPRADLTALESELESQVPAGAGFELFMGPAVAKKLARQENAMGVPLFKGLNEDGTGSIFGFKVNLVPYLDQLTDTVSGGGKDVTILAAHKDSIRLGYAPRNQGLAVRTYDQGIVDLDDGLGTPAPVNLIQQNAVLFLAELRTNWIVARQNVGVALLSGTNWDLT